ncbi:hypothetical protein N7519_009561 [Penicillium mononematosum]|uniref:uncharacterized protein n=1 Tax=Penicillium mononematosum TaxID=268346 RepID=UPI00254904D8|nr:uncharacterized protein N7519_009561 [Penicillium mononematosum]KAJ6179100.1 hypothetical protein N7519_009561 [Penicillium mononematosum]
MRYALIAPVLLAVTALAVPVPNQGDVSVAKRDVGDGIDAAADANVSGDVSADVKRDGGDGIDAAADANVSGDVSADVKRDGGDGIDADVDADADVSADAAVDV